MIISPCISICKTDPSTGYCYGCGRSNEEKLLWKKEDTSDNWKTNNIETIKKHGEKKIKPIIENKISKIRLTINIFFLLH